MNDLIMKLSKMLDIANALSCGYTCCSICQERIKHRTDTLLDQLLIEGY